MIGFGLGLWALVKCPPAVLQSSQGSDEVPRSLCRICGTPSTMAPEYVAHGGLCVCSDCAETVANVFNYYHGGRYLTWPNAPRAEPRGYRKKEIPDGLRWQVFERDDFRCKHCGSRQQLRADHIVPESSGGQTTLSNLQTLCHRCNSSKGTRR